MLGVARAWTALRLHTLNASVSMAQSQGEHLVDDRPRSILRGSCLPPIQVQRVLADRVDKLATGRGQKKSLQLGREDFAFLEF
jgi:hypothetical protein